MDTNVFYRDHLEPEPVQERRGGVWEFQEGPIFDFDYPGRGTTAGVPMSAERTLMHAAYHNAITRISGDISRLDVCLWRRTGTFTAEPLPDHPMSRLVKEPGGDLRRTVNGRKFWRRIALHLLLWGNAYLRIRRDGNETPVGLWHALPDRTYGLRPSGGELMYHAGYGWDPWWEFVDPFEMCHVEILQDIRLDFQGLEQWKVFRNASGLGLAQENWMSKFYARGGRPGGYLIIPEGSTSLNTKNLERDFRKSYENPEDAFKVIPLHQGADFKDAQHTFKDTELTESRQENQRDAARYYNLRPSEIGLPDSVSYNSRADDARAYVDHTILPLTMGIAAELDYKLLTARQRVSHFFKFDTSQMIAQDFVSRMNAYSVGVGAKILLPNEARQRENLPPLPGGDTFDEPADPDAGLSRPANGNNGRGPTARA